MKISALFTVLCLPFVSLLAEENGEKWWAHELSFDTLPTEQDPPWKQGGKGGLATLEDGKLVIATVDEQQSLAYTLEETTGEASVTVEFRVRARELHGRYAAQFNINADGFVYVIPITNTEEQTYRAVLENGTLTLYRDGETTTVKGNPNPRAKGPAGLLFGDASTVAIGVSEWSLLRWAWGRAVPAN